MESNAVNLDQEAVEARGTIGRSPGTLRALWIVAVRELADHVTSARFLAIALMVVGLTPLTVYVGVRDYQMRLGEYNRLEIQRTELISGSAGERVGGMDSEDERIMLRALHRPEPMSVLVRGLDGALPQYWEFTSLGTRIGPAAATPQRLADTLGHLDMEFLVRVVIGLLAILLAFDAVAGEKELGTLRAVLSQPISRTAFLGGKLLGGAVTLFLPLASSVLVALLGAQILGVDLIAGDPLTKVALLTLTSAIYLVCLYTLGLLVSSLVTSQKTALVVLLVGWVIAVLAIPPMSTLVAQAVSPVPPPNATETQKQALDTDIRVEGEEAAGAVYREVAGLPEGYAAPSAYREHKDEIDRRVAPIILNYQNERRTLLGEIDRDIERRTDRQGAVARGIMMLSPAAAFAATAADLAGTGDATRRAWLTAVQQQQGRLDRILFEDPPAIRIRNVNAWFTADRRTPPPAADLPAFTAPRRDAGAAVARTLPMLGLLLLYSALFTTGAFFAFSRYDVR